jgi:hypothetical protein
VLDAVRYATRQERQLRIRPAMMRDPLITPADACAPDADWAGPNAPVGSPEWLARWLAMLMLFLLEPWNAVRLLRSGRPASSWWHDRPDLPAGSAQAYFASVRGAFGNSIRWMCLRHGIGPGHKDWPELSRAIVAFGSSVEGFRAGAPPCGLLWWENPGVIPGIVLVPGFGAFAAAPARATAALLEQQAVASAPPPAPHAMQAEATHARLPASWLPASVRQIFARAGPGPSTGPPGCPVLPTPIMSDERGRSMASPAVVIRADWKSDRYPEKQHAQDNGHGRRFPTHAEFPRAL